MVLRFFQWCQDSSVATIAASSWLAPVVEVVHLVGLTMLVGAIVLVSLRLLGLLMTSRPVSEIAADLWPWTVLGLLMQLANQSPHPESVPINALQRVEGTPLANQEVDALVDLVRRQTGLDVAGFYGAASA